MEATIGFELEKRNPIQARSIADVRSRVTPSANPTCEGPSCLGGGVERVGVEAGSPTTVNHQSRSDTRQRDNENHRDIEHGDPLEQDLPRGRPHLPQVPRRRPRLARLRIEDLRRRPLPQVPDLRAPHPAVPGKLSGRRGHPGLAPGGARAGEAARGDELAGVRVPARDRRQPVPVADGPRLPGPVRGRLQPQRGGGLRRHQRRGAVHRRHRHRGRLRLRAPRTRHRKACRDHRRRAGRTHRRVPAPPARPPVHHLRRPRGARRHDALRHPRLPHAAAVPRQRDRPHPRTGRHRDATLHARRPRRELRGDRGGTRCGPVDDRMPERAPASGAGRRRAELRERGEVPGGVQHRPAPGRGGPGGVRRRRRHLDRRGLRRPPARTHQPDQPQGPARDGGARLRRPRRRGGGGAHRGDGDPDLAAAALGHDRGRARGGGCAEGRGDGAHRGDAHRGAAHR